MVFVALQGAVEGKGFLASALENQHGGNRFMSLLASFSLSASRHFTLFVLFSVLHFSFSFALVYLLFLDLSGSSV